METTYEDIKYSDRTSLQYINMLTTLVLYNQIPFQALVFDNDSKRKTIIVLKASPSGGINTKQITTKKEKMAALEDNLTRDFPNISIHHISSEDVINAIAEQKS